MTADFYAQAIDFYARAARRRCLRTWRRRAASTAARRGDALLALNRHAVRALYGAWTHWRGAHVRRAEARVAARAFAKDLDAWRRRRLLKQGLARLRRFGFLDPAAALAAGAMARDVRGATAAVRRWRAWVRGRQEAAVRAQLATALVGQLRLVRALRAWQERAEAVVRGRRVAEEAEAWDRALQLSRGLAVWRARGAWRRQRELAAATRECARRWLRRWLLWAAARQARAEAELRAAALARARRLGSAMLRWRQGSLTRRRWAMAGVFRGREAAVVVQRARLRIALRQWAQAQRRRRAAMEVEALRRRGLLAQAWSAWRGEAAVWRGHRAWRERRAQRAWKRWRAHIDRSRQEGYGVRRALWAWKAAREAAAWRRWQVGGSDGWLWPSLSVIIQTITITHAFALLYHHSLCVSAGTAALHGTSGGGGIRSGGGIGGSSAFAPAATAAIVRGVFIAAAAADPHDPRGATGTGGGGDGGSTRGQLSQTAPSSCCA